MGTQGADTEAGSAGSPSRAKRIHGDRGAEGSISKGEEIQDKELSGYSGEGESSRWRIQGNTEDE